MTISVCLTYCFCNEDWECLINCADNHSEIKTNQHTCVKKKTVYKTWMKYDLKNPKNNEVYSNLQLKYQQLIKKWQTRWISQYKLYISLLSSGCLWQCVKKLSKFCESSYPFGEISQKNYSTEFATFNIKVEKCDKNVIWGQYF